MSSTEREKIISDVMEALAGIPGVQTLHRSRHVALNDSAHPSILVEPVSDNADRTVVGLLTWSFTFQVSVLVRAQIPDTASDRIVAEVHRRIMQGAFTQRESVIDVAPVSSNWTFSDNSSIPLAIVLNLFQVDYRTQTNDIYT